jgi:hypothetical protein
MDPETRKRLDATEARALDEELSELADAAASSPILVAYISRLRNDPRLTSEPGRREVARMMSGALVLGVQRHEQEVIEQLIRLMLPPREAMKWRPPRAPQTPGSEG